MKTHPDKTVTVVIPYCEAYTPKSMLEKAINSVEIQDVPSDIHVVTDRDQRGPAWARNQGLEQATTRYVAFLDADDLWHEQKLSRQLDEMERTNAALCLEGDRDMSTDEFICALLNDSISSLTPSILVDTEQVDTRFRTSLERFEDHLFMVEAAAAGGVCFCEDLVTILKHDDGLSSTGTYQQKAAARRQMMEIINDEVPAARPYLENIEGLAEYAIARHAQIDGKYRSAIGHALRSMRSRPALRPLAVIGLSLFGWFRDRVQIRD